GSAVRSRGSVPDAAPRGPSTSSAASPAAARPRGSGWATRGPSSPVELARLNPRSRPSLRPGFPWPKPSRRSSTWWRRAFRREGGRGWGSPPLAAPLPAPDDQDRLLPAAQDRAQDPLQPGGPHGASLLPALARGDRCIISMVQQGCATWWRRQDSTATPVTYSEEGGDPDGGRAEEHAPARGARASRCPPDRLRGLGHAGPVRQRHLGGGRPRAARGRSLRSLP